MDQRSETRRAIGQQIAQLRRQRKLTQEMLGSMLGFRRTQVSRLENGWSPIDIVLLPELAKHLGCTISDITHVIEPMAPTPLANNAQRLHAKNQIQMALNEVEDMEDLKLLMGMLGLVAVKKGGSS